METQSPGTQEFDSKLTAEIVCDDPILSSDSGSHGQRWILGTAESWDAGSENSGAKSQNPLIIAPSELISTLGSSMNAIQLCTVLRECHKINTMRCGAPGLWPVTRPSMRRVTRTS